MRLSGAVEQACCIIILLVQPARRAPVTNNSLAKRMGVSPTYITKVTRKLVRAGLITSARGAGGGFRLARAYDTITLRDITEAIEGSGTFVQYQGVAERMFAHQPKSKLLRGANIILRTFDEAQERWLRALQSVTIQDVVKEVAHD